jgi:uncharacterized RDD family membrane protein YckC
MKCPKCDYLGFETGDTCRNCGYDFSLMVSTDLAMPDIDLEPADDSRTVTDDWLGALDSLLEPEPSVGAHPLEPVVEAELPLPLFTPGHEVDDQPLIRLPAAPRAPLSVRRTPENPRLRTVAKAVRKTPEPSFEFADEPAARVDPDPPASARPRAMAAVPASMRAASGAGARLGAAAIDHAILLTIDLSVVYFTLKIAALTLGDWRLLPLAPLMTFLLLLKLAYFAAFTAVGGQTIGKMGSGIRVIADDDRAIDAARALRRSLAGGIALATLGAAFAPALFGAEGRALHDRIAGTRVVTL